MAIANPDYDPNWEARHDAATVACEEFVRVRSALHASADGPVPEESYLHRRHDAAVKELQNAFVAQFRTIQEYADWAFRWLPDREWLDEVPDLDAFGSLEEVREAVRRATRRIELRRTAQRNQLPVEQPAGLIAFSENHMVSSRFHVFVPGEIWRGAFVVFLHLPTLYREL